MISKKGIAILLALIILLILTLVFVGGMNSISNIVEFDGIEETPVVFKADSESVSEITVKTPKEKFTFFKDSEGIWKCMENEEIKISDSKLKTLEGALLYMNAYQLIKKNPDNLTDYGLDSAEYVITAKTDNKSVTFCRGKETPIGNYYYFKMSDSDDVYAQYAATCRILFAPLSEYED